MSDALRAIVIIVAVLAVALNGAGLLIWAERRLLALWQDRLARTGSVRSASVRLSPT